MEAIKSIRPKDNAEIQRRKAQLKKEIEVLRAEIRQLNKKSETSSISPSASGSNQIVRKPGRFKGKFFVGPEFFGPLTDEEIQELMGE